MRPPYRVSSSTSRVSPAALRHFDSSSRPRKSWPCAPSSERAEVALMAPRPLPNLQHENTAHALLKDLGERGLCVGEGNGVRDVESQLPAIEHASERREPCAIGAHDVVRIDATMGRFSAVRARTPY